MSEELVKSNWTPSALTKRKMFDDMAIAVLRESYGKKLSNIEFSVFIQTSTHLGLDPFAKEIYPVKFGDHPMTLIPAISGLRKLAVRSGRYLGLTPGTLLVRTEDGHVLTVPHSEYDPETHVSIISATIGVIVDGYPGPVMGTALYKSMVQKINGREKDTWANMPDVMILTAAERAALRRTGLFPDSLTGVFTDDVETPDDAIEIRSVPVSNQAAAPPVPEPAIFPPVNVETAPSKSAAPIKRGRPFKAAAPTKEIPEAVVEASAELPEKTEQEMDGDSPMASLLLQVFDYMEDLLPDTHREEGLLFVRVRLCEEFGVKDLSDLTAVDAVRAFCKGPLIKELRQENYLPMLKQ